MHCVILTGENKSTGENLFLSETFELIDVIQHGGLKCMRRTQI